MKREISVILLMAVLLLMVETGCGRKGDPVPVTVPPASTERAG